MPLVRPWIERIIGYDLRVSGPALDAEWPAERRTAYLLKHSVSRPHSVDPGCWMRHPSSGDEIVSVFGLSAIQRSQIDAAPLARHDVTVPLWPCFHTMEQYFRWLQAERGAPGVMIAVTLAVPADQKVTRRYPHGSQQLSDKKEVLDDEWQLLGYDVADPSLLSGLMNCGYTPDTDDPFKRHWAMLLNESHLAKSMADAIELAKAIDDRVPEHAPFDVYGVYRYR